MDTSKIIFILSVLVKSCFGGTSSICGPIVSNFATLSQITDTILDDSVFSVNQLSADSPVTANGCAHDLICTTNEMLSLISDGTGRLTGVDESYVSKILNGQVEPPFEETLDCIQDGLIALRDKINFIKSTNVENITSKFVPADVAPNAACSDLQSDASAIYNAQIPKVQYYISINADFISTFKALNMGDLFEKYLISQISCDTESVAIAIADMVGGSHSEAVAYVDRSSSQLSYPLDCVQDIIDEGATTVDSAYTQVIGAI